MVTKEVRAYRKRRQKSRYDKAAKELRQTLKRTPTAQEVYDWLTKQERIL